MKRITLALSVLVLSLSLALSPLSVMAAEISSAAIAQQMPSLAPMLEKVMPSVVSINVEGSTTVSISHIPCNFQQFFGNDSPFCQEGLPLQSSPFYQGGLGDNGGDQQQRSMALGPGVTTDADKDYVITNNHVVNNTTVIKVQLSDGHKFDAKMVGKDPCSDIALIRIQSPRNLTVIKTADSDVLRVDDYIVAIGNPSGPGGTVISGIAPALGRNGLNAKNYENFIQTDAAINRGNSGDVLANLDGEPIGINTATLAPDGGNIGIGFAISSNMVKNLTSQMVEYGQAKHGESDIMSTGLNPDLAKMMKANIQRGVFVSQVPLDSSVAKAGIKAGDVITSLNGKPISSLTALRARVGIIPVGNRLTLDLLCNGKQVSVSLEPRQSSQNQTDSSIIFSGIEGVEMSNKGKGQGMVMNNVKTGIPIVQIGPKKGDVIIGANQQAMKSIVELCKALDSKPLVLVLNIQCGDSTIYLLVQ